MHRILDGLLELQSCQCHCGLLKGHIERLYITVFEDYPDCRGKKNSSSGERYVDPPSRIRREDINIHTEARLIESQVSTSEEKYYEPSRNLRTYRNKCEREENELGIHLADVVL